MTLAVKRALDAAAAGAGLIALSPLLAAIAIAIKIEAPRLPLFFNDTVMGRQASRFRISCRSKTSGFNATSAFAAAWMVRVCFSGEATWGEPLGNHWRFQVVTRMDSAASTETATAMRSRSADRKLMANR